MLKLANTRWIGFAFAIICIFYAYEFFLRIMPSMVVDELLTQYHINAVGIGGFATSYFFGYVLLQIPAGFIYDRYSFRWVAAFGLITCVIGTLLFTFATELWLGLVGRFILGCGSAFAFIGAITFIRRYLPERYFTLLVALVIAIGTVAGAFGQVFAIKIIQYLSWRFTIDGMALWGIFLALLLLCIPERKLANNKVPHEDSFAAIWQDFRLVIANRTFWINGFIGSFMYLPTSILAGVWGLQYFQKGLGSTPELGALAISLLFVGWAIGGPIFSYLVHGNRVTKWVLAISSWVASFVLLWLLMVHTMGSTELLVILFLLGLISSAQVLVWRIFNNIFPNPKMVGTASSATNLVIMLTIAIWDLIIGQFINWTQSAHGLTTSTIDPHSLRISLLILPILMLLASILVYFLPRKTI